MGWKLKELQYGARNKAEIEWIEKSDSDIIHTKYERTEVRAIDKL